MNHCQRIIEYQNTSRCLAPGLGARAYPGGFDILTYFHFKFIIQGENTDVKYPFPGGEVCLI